MLEFRALQEDQQKLDWEMEQKEPNYEIWILPKA